jgi:hypothetical protein
VVVQAVAKINKEWKMIPSFLSEKPNMLHAIYGVQLQTFKVKAFGYCNVVGNAADGVFSVPEWAFDGRASYQNLPAGETWPICPRCAQVLKAVKEPPK